ncbi:MAG: hypothetical protein AB7O32_10120 [Vicinamibacterales bacterium]
MLIAVVLSVFPSRRVQHGRLWRPALVVTAALVLPTSSRAQDTTLLECNERVSLTATPRFDPPVSEPLQYEWRDRTDTVLGTEPILDRAFPVGRFDLTLRAYASAGRTAVARMALEVRDTLPPAVRTVSQSLEVDNATVGAAGFDLFRAVGFSARDLCDSRPQLRVEPPGPYSSGTTTVRLSATDAAGNTASVSLPLTVVTTPAAGAPARPGERRGAAGTASDRTAGRSPVGEGAQAAAPPVPGGPTAPGAPAAEGAASSGETDRESRAPADAADVGARSGPSGSPGTPSRGADGGGPAPPAPARADRSTGASIRTSETTSFVETFGPLAGVSLALGAFVLLARRRRQREAAAPPLILPQGTLCARATPAAAHHEVVLLDGFPQPQLAVRFRPRSVPGDPVVDAVDDVVATQTLE